MKVLIVDDQRIVREGLATIVASLPDMQVVGTAANGSEAVALSQSAAPDVVLMDLRMPVMDGVAATAQIRSQQPGTAVVVLTTFADDESIMAALSAGATGYLTKDATTEQIRRAIETAASGQTVLDSDVHAMLMRAASTSLARAPARSGPLPDGLTEREAEVLGLIAEGRSNSEIAQHLFVAEATVKTHINRIFAKTSSRDRAQAAAYAHRHGLDRPAPGSGPGDAAGDVR